VPRGQALDKLFSVLFSVDIKGNQDIQYGQCVSSLVNLNSPCKNREKLPSVAERSDMTKKEEEEEEEEERSIRPRPRNQYVAQ